MLRSKLTLRRPSAKLRPGFLGLALALALFGAGSAARAQPPGFAFLEVTAGARASSMAGAYASLAQGAEAAFWNPAGLGGVKGFQVSANHAELFADLRYDAVSVAGGAWGGGWGLSMRALYSDAIDERDDIGNLIGSFGSHDLEFKLSYGRKVGSGFSVGGSTQLVRERLADNSAQTYAFDLGAAWEPSLLQGSRLSLSAHNLGPSARYTIDGVPGEDVPLPKALQAGFSLSRPVGSAITLRGALEGRFSEGSSGVGMLGAEVATSSGAALRAGWRVNDASSNFTLGAGYAGKGFQFDYAFIPLQLDLGDSHRFSVGLQF